MAEILLGSHVGMSGKEMFLGSVKEAESYGCEFPYKSRVMAT